MTDRERGRERESMTDREKSRERESMTEKEKPGRERETETQMSQ